MRKILFLIVALLTAATAWANESYRYFDVSSRTFKTGTVPNGATILTEADIDIRRMGESDTTTWYVIQGNLPGEHSIALRGTVNLVLRNGADASFKGMYMTDNTKLNIYAQTDDVSTMGKLTSISTSDHYAGIGTSSYYTTENISINIHGGKINATGGFDNAGIGGYSYKSGGTINIFGGVVTAQGGKSAAGIGGGYASQTTDVNIYGGQITARGGDGASGIGAGKESQQSSIFLSWNNPNYDWIYASSYNGTVTIDPDHGFMLAETGEEATTSNIGGKKIVPDQATVFSVTFNTGEGSTAVASQGIINGQTATMPENPYRKGYRFLKWQLNGIDYDFSTPVTSNIELTAVWTPLPDIQYLNSSYVSTILAGADYTPMESTVTMLNNNEIWVVMDDVTIPDRITVKGNVTLILTDGKTLTAKKGISVSSRDNASLTILSQRGGTGTLIAGRGHQNEACIGGNNTVDTRHCGTVSIYGGHVKTQDNYMGAGIGGGHNGRGGTINIMGGQIEVTGSQWGGNAIGYGYFRGGYSTDVIANITLGWRNESDYIRFVDQRYSDESANCKGTVTLASSFLLDGTTTSATWTNDTDNNFWSQKLVPDLTGSFSVSDDGNTYTIHSASGWDLFCNMLEGGESFSGKTVKLGAFISVSRMAGNTGSDDSTPFCGTFDGCGKTLTFNYSGSEDFIAPFAWTHRDSSPTFRNLTVGGTINSTGSYAAGLVGHLFGTVTVEHCTSSVDITCTSGAGGFVGLCEHNVNFNDCLSSAVTRSSSGNNSGFVGWSRASGHAISFTGCVFKGKLLQIDSIGASNGCFIGWTGSNKTVTITDCLVDTVSLANGETLAIGNSATFARGWNATTTASNSYYIAAFGTSQGQRAHSIAAGENVTALENAGEPSTVYDVSGITAYPTGIKYNNVLYAGNGEEVSLTLDHSLIGDLIFANYEASAGTLSGSDNPYKLIMPDMDVIVAARYEPLHLRGDVNRDRTIDIDDVTALINYVLSGDSTNIVFISADCHYDGSIDIDDVTALISYVLNGSWNE